MSKAQSNDFSPENTAPLNRVDFKANIAYAAM